MPAVFGGYRYGQPRSGVVVGGEDTNQLSVLLQKGLYMKGIR